MTTETLSHSDIGLTKEGNRAVWIITIHAGTPKCRDCGTEIKSEEYYCRETKKFRCGLCEAKDLGYSRCFRHIQFILGQTTSEKHTHFKVRFEYKPRESKVKADREVYEDVEAEQERD